MTPAVLFGLTVAGIIICLGSFLYQQMGARVRRRLKAQAGAEMVKRREEKKIEFLPPAVVEKVEEKLGLNQGSTKVKELRKVLVRAGIYRQNATALYFGLKFGLCLALPVVLLPALFSLRLPKPLFLAAFLLLMGLGYYLPTLIVNHLVTARQRKIREGLPDALDLLVVCVEAGQGLNAALKRVADDLSLSNPPLAHELTLVNLEISAGLEREQALRNLADRTAVEEVASLCSMLIQSDRFGTSMSTALRVQSDTLRTTRRQKLEELAAKTPVKLVFPLLLFIFPALMVVIIGPAVIRIMENLK
ncbi:MAG: type II secretion system F family protein [Deltaproteobacteria bacterium]|nr:type II secretion system F family protein [Deltaproteobacteria bacterium]